MRKIPQSDVFSYCKEVLEKDRITNESELRMMLVESDLLSEEVLTLFLTNARGDCIAALKGAVALLGLDLTQEFKDGMLGRDGTELPKAPSDVRRHKGAQLPNGGAKASPIERKALTLQACSASAAAGGVSIPTSTSSPGSTISRQSSWSSSEMPNPPPPSLRDSPAPPDVDAFGAFLQRYGEERDTTSNSDSNSTSKPQQHQHYVCPFQLPPGVIAPPTAQLHKIMEETATRAASRPEFSLYLREKCKSTPLLAFVSTSHPMHPYYLFLLQKAKLAREEEETAAMLAQKKDEASDVVSNDGTGGSRAPADKDLSSIMTMLGLSKGAGGGMVPPRPSA